MRAQPATTAIHRWLAPAVAGGLLLAAFGGAGCSPGAARFRSGDRPTAASTDDENESRFATKIREELRREDDRPVDVAAIAKKLTSRPKPSVQYLNTTPAGVNRDRVLLEVVSYLGVPYVYGGNTKEGIDCSGFTLQVYKNASAIPLPRSSREQFGAGRPVARQELQFGDLVFFNTTGRVPSHVGIYIEDDVFAHASVTQGVTLSSLESTYYRNRYVGARRMTPGPRG